MYNFALYDRALVDKINLKELDEAFGQEITYECLKRIYAPKSAKSDDELKNLLPINFEQFKEKLLSCGIEVKEWYEPLIDEDSGEVEEVKMVRWNVKEN